MTKERYDELMFGPEPQRLTSEEMKEGWHFCDELDGLLVSPEVRQDSIDHGWTCNCFKIGLA